MIRIEEKLDDYIDKVYPNGSNQCEREINKESLFTLEILMNPLKVLHTRIVLWVVVTI